MDDGVEVALKIIGIFVGVTILCFLFSFVMAVPVMLLWNWLVPIVIPGGAVVATITYWQSWGLMILCGILFKGGSGTASAVNSCKSN